MGHGGKMGSHEERRQLHLMPAFWQKLVLGCLQAGLPV